MKRSVLFLLSLSCMFSAQAQQGYSSGTMGMLQSESYYEAYVNNKDLSSDDKAYYRNGALEGLLPEKVVPEEMINYHHHLIALPEKGSKVNLAPVLVEHPLQQNHYLLQLGIATETVVPDEHGSVGVMYILDISGSMQGEKLEQAKKAMIASLDKMSPSDYFGVTLFDNTAEVLIAYEKFGKRKEEIVKKIEALTTRGGTNIMAGLDMGIDQMMTMNLPEHPKSILLLTDGNTNVGVTEGGQIIENYRKRTNNGIRITTLGIGIDLRQDMLRALSSETHGQFHFIERDEDIFKTCVNEFSSLTSPIGKSVVLSVQIPAGFDLKKVYGASEWVMKEGVLQVQIDDINYFLTQIVMVDLELSSTVKMDISKLEAELSYTDAMDGKAVSLKSKAAVVTAEDEKAYRDIMKNYLISDWATSLRDFSQAYRSTKNVDVLKKNVGDLLNNPLIADPSLSKDEDIVRIKTVFEKIAQLVA